jgi:hypothetical protein
MLLMGLPPTTNNAYFDNVVYKFSAKKGKNVPIVNRVLTDEGDKYKTDVKAKLTQEYPGAMMVMRKDIPLGLAIRLDFPEAKMLNLTWPKKAKTRYKKLDASNRVKLLEDAIATAGGVDDSQFQIVITTKMATPGGQGFTHIWIWNIDEEGWVPSELPGDLSKV